MTRVAAVQAAPAASRIPSSASSSTQLQRKCACGGGAGFDRTCEECGKQTLQRKVNNGFAAPATPPIVHSTLRSPGRPLDPATRTVFEARLGHNFGRVRVHADAHAAASAKAVNALAYTVGEHVVFAPGRFRPQDPEGRLLLGHELAHVVQQSAGGSANPASEAALEAEADRVAAAAESGGRPAVMHRIGPHLLRQEATPSPQPRAPTEGEQNIIETARADAERRTHAALMRLGGTIPPAGRGGSDPGAAMRGRAGRLARLLFDWDEPNMDQIGQVLGFMESSLRGPEVVIAQANDPQCGERAAYVRGSQPPIILCPRFFANAPAQQPPDSTAPPGPDLSEQQIRTLIHEAAHLAGIGRATLDESYCVSFDCESLCGGFKAADTWAQFVHCLTDQPADASDRVQAGGPPPKAAEKSRDLAGIAARIRKGIEGAGTDEEAVYAALQELDRDPDAIRQVMDIYKDRYPLTLIEDIRDDFEGEELEYALQLLNLGDPGTAQRIDSSPLYSARTAADRIREAVEIAGTDEEAIYAALLPFARDTLDVQRAYSELYHEDLRDRLIEEMSGSELEYALSLLETPYERYIQEGNARLADAPFGAFGDVRNYCTAAERTTTGGTERIYWYDRKYWEPDREITTEGGEQKLSCKVKLLSDKSPAEAIDQLFDHQDRWLVACAEFVQIVHLYALRHMLGATRFDATVGGKLTLEIRRRGSTGVETEVVFKRDKPDAPMIRSDTGEPERRTAETLLAVAAIGSRVRWTNLDGRPEGEIKPGEEPNAWENENTIKLGPDKFGAHGTATFFSGNTHTRAEVEEMTAQGTNPDADASYVRRNIFISEIEFFRSPVEQ